MTVGAEAAGAPHLVAFTAPTEQVRAIPDAAEAVRVRLVLLSAMAGEQRTDQLQRLAGELQALGAAPRGSAARGARGRLVRQCRGGAGGARFGL